MKYLATAAILTASASAFAHGDQKPQYGGIVTEVNEINFELVAKSDSIAIYVDEQGKKVDTKGAIAKVTLLSGGAKAEVSLMPAGENKLEAKGAFKVCAGTKAVSSVSLAGRLAATARYEIK